MQQACTCEAILHAGDIGGQDIMLKLREAAPVYAVKGNIDKEPLVKETKRLVCLFITHWYSTIIICKIKEPDSAINRRVCTIYHQYTVHIGANGNKLFYGIAHLDNQKEEGCIPENPFPFSFDNFPFFLYMTEEELKTRVILSSICFDKLKSLLLLPYIY